jgi:hypothetical protein
VVVVDDELVVDVLELEVELVEVLVVDELVEVEAGGLVVLVVVGVAVPGSGAAHAPTQSAAAVTDATNSEPRPIGPYRQMARRP